MKIYNNDIPQQDFYEVDISYFDIKNQELVQDGIQEVTTIF